jgi:TPR repeat protein
MRRPLLLTVAVVAALAPAIARSARPVPKPLVADPALKAKCAAGDMEACVAALVALVSSREAPELMSHLDEWREGCEAEAANDKGPLASGMCLIAGAVFTFAATYGGPSSANAEGRSEYLERGARYAQRACDLGQEQGCLFRAMIEFWKPKPDLAAIVRRMERLCTRGNADGCWILGVLTYRGSGVLRDPAGAEKLFQRACSARVIAACQDLRRVRANEPGARAKVRPEPVGAQLDWEVGHPSASPGVGLVVACASGESVETCGSLVARVEPKRSEEQELSVLLFHARCARGDWEYDEEAYTVDADACLVLADRLKQGDAPVPRDPARARAILRVACQKGVKEACAPETKP